MMESLRAGIKKMKQRASCRVQPGSRDDPADPRPADPACFQAGPGDSVVVSVLAVRPDVIIAG
jgi:hypothetical protein